MKEMLTLYNRQISQDFTEAFTYLSENCVQNTDFASLSVADDTDVYLHTARVIKVLAAGNYSFSNMSGLFVYFPSKDIFVRQLNASHSIGLNNTNCSVTIRKMLHEYRDSGTLDEIPLNKWFLLSTNDENFIVRFSIMRGIYTGVWVSLSHIADSFTQFQDMGSVMLCVGPDGYCLTNDEFAGVQLIDSAAEDTLAYHRSDLFHSYMIVADKLPDTQFSIIALIPTSYVSAKLAVLYGILAFMLFWLVLFSIGMIAVMNRFFRTPSMILQPVIDSMRAGEFKSKIQADNQYQEIRVITDVFNDMIGEIRNLRIRLYEDQLTQKEMELKYLRSQIAPHFLINCLNTIFAMSQEKDSQKIMYQTISTLSEHLRYSLASRQRTSLDEEIRYVKNYLLLTQLRFPRILSYEIDLDSEVYAARIIPHLLLMLSENSIKVNLVMGEDFFIKITGRIYDENDERRVHLTHIDSGCGFDADSLQIYNHIMDHPEVVKNGYGIGLYNIVMRMLFTMGDSSKIEFSNEQGLGARIDIDFRFVPYREDDEGTIPYQGRA